MKSMDAHRTIARLLSSAAAHEGAGDPSSAEREYRRAIRRLKVSASTPRPVQRQRARALIGLGQLLEHQGRYRAAARLLTQAVTSAERGFGLDALEVSTALNNLGVCYKYLGRFLDAGPLYQRALAIAERRLGPDHADVATLYHNLGGLEHSAGNWARGEPFARRSVRIRSRALGPRHPHVAHDLTALAALLDGQKKFDESERLYRRAIVILEREYGADSHDVAVALNNLAAVQQARGRPKQAEALYRRALAIETTNLGDGHPKTAFCANNLASLLKTRGRVKEAAALFRQALEVFTATLGRDHPNVAICLENYADTLRKLRRWREARACAKRAARILGTVEAVNDDAVALTGTINPALAQFRLDVRRSRIHRLGVFAEEPIPPRRKVIEYTGERISRRESKRRWDPSRSYLFLVDSYWRLDGAIGGSGAELINHSCEPNLRTRLVRGRIFYYSRRAIAAGEELTVDYKYSEELRPIRCRCGAPTCRGTMNLPRRRDTNRRSRRRRPTISPSSSRP
jgi:tetratricopeptide (TPR) repeat protein